MTVTWGGRARARLGALAFVVALAACNGSEKVQQKPRLMEVGSFVGQVDVLTGAMTITSTGADPFPMGLVFRNTLEEIPVSQNGIWGDVGEGAVEMRGLRATAHTWEAACAVDGSDTWEMDVEIHSGFAGTRLVRPYVEITNLSETGFDSCISAPPPESAEPALSDVYGLFQYPDMEPGAVSTATWSFRVGGATSFTFYGKVWAERVDLTAPTTTASVPAGSYTAPQLLTLTCSDGTGSDTGCANTYYSVDYAGTTTYVGPIHLSGVQPICYWSDDLRGNTESNHHCGTYTTTASAGTVTYDGTLHATHCAGIASTCDTGSLVTGRGTMTGGNEPNAAANALDGCADGNLGVYGTNESLDRLVLRTDDGGPLAAGRSVTVDGHVIAVGAVDRFEVYWASTTTSAAVVWQQVGATQTASGAGAQTLSVGFTMPEGAVAIRGRFGQDADGVSCGATGTDDQDDLVFTQDVPALPTAAPSISLGVPIGGWDPDNSRTSVSGGVLLSAAVPVDSDVASVEFLFRLGGAGAFSSIGIDYGPPWALAWDATHHAGASVDFQARVTDRAGRTADSAVVTSSLRENPPTVRIENVADGATFPVAGGPVTVNIYGYKYNGVSYAELYIDGDYYGDATGTYPDFTIAWDPAGLATSIRHTMYARAYDYPGTVAQTIPIHFTVY